MEYQEGDLVLCTVESVSGTVVFVNLPDKTKGTIISSEIAPGRIKNMRQYVVPNKKIVCKILRISPDKNHIDLSLRRVTMKERKEVMQKFKQEQATKMAFKQILKDSTEETTNKILEKFSTLNEFLEKSKEDNSLLEKYIPKNAIEQIKKIAEKKKKEISLNFEIKLKCLESDGVKKIKNIFDFKEDKIKITYLSAGRFQLKITADDFKSGKHASTEILEKLEKKAKENSCELSYEEIKK